MGKPRAEPLETLPMLPPLPGWIVSAQSDTPEAAAFRSGAALAHLGQAMALGDVPLELWRDRLALTAAGNLLLALLRSQVRFKMASSLHLEAVAEDFESLRREHARLMESEARYKTLSEELEERVRKQTAQLEERQQMLYQAEKLASVGQLAAGMAHTMLHRNGRPSTRTNSTMATRRCVSASSSARRKRVGCRRRLN